MKTCSACKRSLTLTSFGRCSTAKDGLSYRCKACSRAAIAATKLRYPDRYKYQPTSEDRAKHRARIKAWVEKHPERDRAESRLRTAVHRGKISKLPCEVCGNPKVHGHHDDYSKPLEVRWLCPSHHRLLHEEQARAAA